jgi:hypothetical protein
MADDTYKSGPFKGYSKEEVRSIKDFLKDSNAKQSDIAIAQLLETGFFSGNKGGAVKSRTGSQDFRKGGMVISTVDNRKRG